MSGRSMSEKPVLSSGREQGQGQGFRAGSSGSVSNGDSGDDDKEGPFAYVVFFISSPSHVSSPNRFRDDCGTIPNLVESYWLHGFSIDLQLTFSPRPRALLACLSCRARRNRCSGERPICAVSGCAAVAPCTRSRVLEYRCCGVARTIF
jgi:hypothetical protein